MQIYDRSSPRVTRNIVERISIQRKFEMMKGTRESKCTGPNPFAALMKSSWGGPLIYRSALAFTSSGGSARELISWLLTDTSFSRGQASAPSKLNIKTGG